MTTNERKQTLETQLSNIAGLPVEITVRGPQSFTISYETINDAAKQALTQFFAVSTASLTTEEDDECGTFLYLEISHEYES